MELFTLAFCCGCSDIVVAVVVATAGKIYMHACMHACIRTYAHTRTHTHIPIIEHTYIR
jgi:hypothetical protein